MALLRKKSARLRPALRLALGCIAVALCSCSAFARTFTAFGPKTYAAGSKPPATFSNSFSILNPNTQYTLHVQNSGVSSATISINGVQILGTTDFEEKPPIIDKSITLQLNNTIVVQVQSKPTASMVVSIIGVDNDPPVITASASPAADVFGWNNSNVAVTFTCSDKTSGVASCPSPVTVSTEGANQVISGTATDKAGNTASTSVTINLDKTAPTIAANPVPIANSFGWNNATVVVSFNCQDALSGIATCTAPATLNGEGVNQVAAGTAVDKAGNMASAKATINIDKTAPLISASVTPAPNVAGWNNGNVNVAFTCSDALSGIASCPAVTNVATEGANQKIAGTAFDNAGNSATTAVSLNLDKTPPTILASPVPAANSFGWNNSSVTVNFICSDALSGIASCASPVTLSQEGAGQIASGKAFDVAGNSSSASATVNIDETPPSISTSSSPAANSGGWNNTDVTVTFTCADSGSGIASCPVPQVVTSEGAKETISGTAADKAGNTATAAAILNIDKTPPSIVPVLSPQPNAAGWNNNTVTVNFNCSDNLSGVASCAAPVIVRQEGAGQAVSGSATDVAGNTSTATAKVNIDETPPTITVAASPAPNANGWNNTSVTVSFICADSLSGIASCPGPQTASTEGANQGISGTATDQAGNSATATATLNIDETPPLVTAIVSPLPNAAGWNNTNVTVSFTCSDALSGVHVCPAQIAATTEGANQVVSGTARDRAGNAATASATLNIDKTPPSLTITSPANGALVIVPTVTLEGTVTDALSGVASVTCNGIAAQVSGSILTCGVPLNAGANVISIVATDVAGNATTISWTVNFSATPTIAIISPVNLSVVNTTPVTVTGTVSDPEAVVTVNGIEAPLSSGSFSVPVPLKEGGNTITVVAQSAGGTPGTATINISLDTTPPHVTIDSPPDGTVTTASTIAVSGLINDIVPGTVNIQQASVTVNGIPAQVLNRAYMLRAVPLSPGPNTITAVGTDLAGNTASVNITVVQQAAVTQPTINLVSGDGQTGTIGTQVNAPLVVQLKDGAGNPVGGKPVVFKVTGSNGTLSGNPIAGDNGGPTLVVNSDANGQAQVNWTLGMRAGAGNNTVKATAAGFVGEVNFGAISLPATPGLISVDSGNNQTGAVGQALPHPFVVVVTDPGHNRLPNIRVNFTVNQGGGTFISQGIQTNPIPSQTNFTIITIKTDSDGRAMAILTLGQQEGIHNNLVEVNFDGNQGFPATFTASGQVAGDPAATSISGVALDNTNVPIAGITLQVDGTALTTQSDQQGQFRLTGVPVGRVKLIADGATAARPGTWPKLEYELVTVSGQNNTLGMPIYLLPLDIPHGLQVDDTHGGTLTLPDVPGFSLTIAPGSVTFPDGGKSGLVSVTVVHADKVPMTPNFGQQPRFIISIQPAGAHFNPPAPMTIPNVDGLSPGEVTEMYSFDHDLGSFVAIGTGTVSKDGSVIKSDPGVGIVKGGWHCGGNPNPGGTAATCGPCATCNGTTCVPNPIQGNTCLNPCLASSTGICAGGHCTGNNLPAGTPCNGSGVCDGQGSCTFPNCSVTCNSGNPCIIDLCFNNQCNPTPNPQCLRVCNGRANGSSCFVGGFGGSCANGQCNTCPSLPNGTPCLINGNQPGFCASGQCQPNPCAGQANGTACSVGGAASVCLSGQCTIQGCSGQSTGTPCNAGGSVPGNCTPDSQGVLQCTGSGNQCSSSCNGGPCVNGNCQNLSCQNGAGPTTGCPDCNTCQGGTCALDSQLIDAPCTSPDKCSFGRCGMAFGTPPTGQCINLFPKSCDDQNICTDDSCTPGPGTCNNILRSQSDLDSINSSIQASNDFATLSSQCPNRTQSNVNYDVDGCSTAGLTFGTNIQDPMVQVWLVAHPGQPLLNVAGNSTAFGANQGPLTSPNQAFDLPCNQHDICYQTCHKGDLVAARSQCDLTLFSDAQRVCNTAYPKTCPYDFITCNKIGGYFDQQAQCLAYAKDYYDVVRAVGNLAAFKGRQTTYCRCCP